MRWLKYIVIGLTSLLIFGVTIIITLALLLDQEQLRDGLVYIVDRTTDHQLEISGPLMLDISLSPSVNVSDIYFKTAAGNFELRAAEIHLQVDILPLRSKYVIVRELFVKNSVVNIRQLPDESEEEDKTSGPLEIRAPIIEKLIVENLAINYSKPYETEPLHITLDSLHKDDEAETEITSLHGAGAIDGTAFKLEGESTAVAMLLTSDQPFLFKYHFDVMQAVIHAEGKISNPRTAGDLDIALQIEATEVQDILELLHVSAPAIGRLAFTGRLTGTIDVPRLDDIEFNVLKDDVAVKVSGHVGNLLTSEDINLDFSTAISDVKLLAELLPDQVPRFDKLQTSGKFSGSAGSLSLDNYTLDASGPRGRRLEVEGSTRIVAAHQPLRDLKATVAFTSPDTEFARQFTDAVPSIGPVSATARVSMDSGILAIRDLKLTAGSKKTVQIEGQGDIGHISFTPTVDVSKMDLKINLTGASARSIGDQINISWPNLINANWPDVGPVKVSGRYSGSLASSSIKELHLQAGAPKQLLIDARGDIKLAALDGDKPLASLGLDINLDAPSTASLSAITGTEIPALGRLKGTAHVGDADGVIAITALDIKVDRGKDFQLALNGSLADLEKLAGVDVKLELSASDLNTLGQPFDQSLPEEGPVKFSARVKGSREKLHYNGRTSLRNTTITTDLTATLTGDRPRLAGSITIPDLDVHDIGIHPEKLAVETSAPAIRDFDQSASEQAVVTEPLFSKEPIDFSGLNAIDLDLEVTINKLSSTAASIADIYSHVLLKNGKLDIKPLKYRVDNDVISNDVMINSSTKPPTVSLLVSGDDIDLGLLLADSSTKEAPIRGVMTAKADMRSRGQSPAQLAANLDGHVYLITENAKVKKSTMNLLNVDVIGFVISNILSPKMDINITCSIFSMHFNKGMGVTDLFIIDSPDILVRIDADVNLVNETMDIAILPEYKVRLYKKSKPMKIYGPITNPTYEVVSLADLTREATRSVLLSPLTISKGLLDNITGLIVKPDEPKGSCDNYLN